MKKNLRIIVIVVLLFSMSACGAMTTPQPTATKVIPTLTLTVNPTAMMLEGTYTTTITDQDLTKGGITGSDLCDNEGLWSLSLRGSRWSLDQTAAQGCVISGLTHFSGTFSIAGDQVVFTQVQQDCGGEFTYKWVLEGTSLVFTQATDDCVPRVVIYEAHPWVKQ